MIGLDEIAEIFLLMIVVRKGDNYYEKSYNNTIVYPIALIIGALYYLAKNA